MLRACAIVILAATASCALAHERDALPSPPVVETSIWPTDVGVAVDASSPPLFDSGPATSCVAYWNALPACPAVPSSVIGQRCPREGDTCGVHCCEPGPPIACIGLRWMVLEHMDDCGGVRCHGPFPCGAGQCAYGRVCMTPAGELASPTPQLCVLPPAPMDSCAAAPVGSLGHAGCTVCGCADTNASGPMITLDCQCC